MKKTRLAALLAGLFMLLLSANLLAYTPPPAPTDGFLSDQAHILSDGDASKLRERLSQINHSTKNEIAVLVLSSLGGEDINDVKFAVFNAWGVGKKGLDNGVLLVWSKGDRKIGIETGKGVGGELTDLQSNDIIHKMKPGMRSGDYAGALTLGVNSVASTLESRHGTTEKPIPGQPAPEHPATNHDDGPGVGLVIAFVLIFLVVVVFLIARRRSGYGGSSFGGWGSGGSWGSGSGSGGGFGGGDSGGGGSSDSY